MAFGSSSVLDDFNRGNGTPGANWSLAHSFVGSALFQIINNQAAPSNDYVISYWNPTTYGPDCEVFATMVVRTTIVDDGPFLCLRLQQPGTGTLDGYCLAVDNTGAQWRIYRITNGALTMLGTAVTSSLGAGDKFGLEAIGTTITAYRKVGTGAWESVLSRTDSTYQSAGYLGLYLGADQATARLDDFAGGAAVAAAQSLVMPNMAQRMRHLLVR